LGNQEVTSLSPYNQLMFSPYYDHAVAKNLSYGDYLHYDPPNNPGNIIERETDRRIVVNAFNTKFLQEAIVKTNIASTQVLHNGLRAINDSINSLNNGVYNLSRQVGSMNSDMNMWFARLDSNIMQSIKEICDRQDAITDILKNPRRTQARELYYMALPNLLNELYEEALADLLKAVDLHKTDCYSWFFIGLTYLIGKNKDYNVVNLDASIEALVKAARYVQPAAKTEQKAKLMAAEIYFFLGLSQQIKAMVELREKKEYKSLLEQARDSYLQSWQYSPDMLEARYNRSRCNLLLNNVKEAMKELGEIILKDPKYCKKAENDNDFALAPKALRSLFNNIKVKVYPEAKTYFDRIEKIKNKIQDTQFHELIQHLKMYSSDTINKNMTPFDILEKYLLYKNILLLYKEFLERTVFRIGINQIELLTGNGGKILKSLCEQYCVKIDIKDDGFVTILGKNAENKEKAKNAIINIITTDLKVGNIYYGIVTRIMDFGVFVEISPGKEGLVHISKLSRKRVHNVKDVVKEERQEIPVKLLEIDKTGRLNLSYIDAIE